MVPRVWALGAFGLTVALVAVAVFLAPPQAFVAAFVPEVLAFAASGAVVALRRPRLPAGWLLLTVGLVWTVVGTLNAYVHTHPDPAVAWVLNWVWVPAFTALVLFLLTFPDGRWFWRGVGFAAIAGGALVIAARALTPGPLAEVPTITNPVGVDGLTAPLAAAETVGNLATATSGVVAVVSVVVRYRRADTTTRRQLLWMGLAGVVWLLVGLCANAVKLFGVAGLDSGNIFIASFAAVPVAAAVAIARYRLFDIDLIVGRTVVVGGLLTFITAVYLVVVIGIGTAVGRTTGSNLFLGVVATALVAVGVQPLHARLMRVARALLQPPVTAREQAAGLAIRTLGAFRVIRDGVAVPATAWQSRKARTLLKVLVARRGRATPREQLMEILWPEQDGDAVSRRLSVALATARAVLDPTKRHPPDHVIAAAQGSLWVDLTHVEVDVEAFLAASASGLEADRAGLREARDLLDQARERYAGDFLEEDRYADWAAPLRDEARAVLRAVLAARARYGDGEASYLRMLELDEYDEQAHLCLIRALDAHGRRGEAQRRYEAYVERMAEIESPAQPYPGPSLNVT